jgi:hypothetical protein
MIALWIFGMYAAGGAQAAQAYQFTGKVTGIKGDTIALSHGLETLEFERAQASRSSRGLRGLKIGDEVTVWYTLQARKAAPYHQPAQQPGRISPAPSPHDVPGKEKHIILDDRAFYDASVERRTGDAGRVRA